MSKDMIAYMKHKVVNLLKDPLVYGSTIILLGTNFANFFHFLFNLLMSRNLSVEDYGTLATLISLIGFPTLIASAISPLIINFAGTYFAKNEFRKIRGLYVKLGKLFFIIALSFFILFLVFIPQISNYFHINNPFLLTLTNMIMFLGFIGVLNMALLQAKLAFLYLTFMNFLNAIIKILFGAVLVFSGFAVGGALAAIFIGSLIAYLLSFFQFKFLFKKEIGSAKINTQDLLAYGLPSALAFIGMTSLISTDILITKHFFTSTEAGAYAVLSLMGRIIFFFSAPVGAVMFPLLVQKFSKAENYATTFKLSFLLVLFISICITILYALFPNVLLSVFVKPEEYESVKGLIGSYIPFFAIHITIYSILSILLNLYLSIKKVKVFIPIILGAFLQIILIYIFHKTLFQVIMISFSITLLLVLSLISYYLYAKKK